MTAGGRARVIARALIPPAVLQAIGFLRSDREWRYLPSWPDVHETWDHESIAASQAERFDDFVAAVQAPNVLGVVPETAAMGRFDPTVQNTYLAFAYALARAAHGRARVSVIDWGGGLGQYHALAKALFPEVELDWVCKELPDLAAEGRSRNPEVRFVTADDELAPADLVLASSSLHYVREWPAQLARLAGLARSWCYITRLPTVKTADDFVLVQDARRHGYEAAYPGWVLNEARFVEQARRGGLALEREVLIHDGPLLRGMPERPQYRGYLFGRGG